MGNELAAKEPLLDLSYKVRPPERRGNEMELRPVGSRPLGPEFSNRFEGVANYGPEYAGVAYEYRRCRRVRVRRCGSYEYDSISDAVVHTRFVEPEHRPVAA